MILTGPEIVRQRAEARLILEPFEERKVQPNSYDLTLGPKLGYYTNKVLDTRASNEFTVIEIPKDGFVLEPNRIYLGASVEVLGSDFYMPSIHSRSGAARLGSFAHVTADIIDPGSVGQTTFQMRVVEPLRVYAEDELAQVVFRCVQGEITLYTGKYQGSRGPQPSRIHRDMLVAA
ncbi:dCTP deaminase [Streptomyces sp. NPDC048718]|uniref:dCTP deaminase n=1 Tax=Streptomyces sp. NPDC048718 TaxID=3365587 RepID=UPI0037222BF7